MCVGLVSWAFNFTAVREFFLKCQHNVDVKKSKFSEGSEGYPDKSRIFLTVQQGIAKDDVWYLSPLCDIDIHGTTLTIQVQWFVLIDKPGKSSEILTNQSELFG